MAQQTELEAAGKLFGFELPQVLSWSIRDGEFSAVVDFGIAGGKKFTISVSELELETEAEAEPEPPPIARKRRTK